MPGTVLSAGDGALLDWDRRKMQDSCHQLVSSKLRVLLEKPINKHDISVLLMCYVQFFFSSKTAIMCLKSHGHSYFGFLSPHLKRNK